MIFVGCCFQVTDVHAHIPALCTVTVHAHEHARLWFLIVHMYMYVRSDHMHIIVCLCDDVCCSDRYATAGQYGKGDLEVKGSCLKL